MKNLFKKSLLVLMITFLTVFVLSLGNKVNAASYTETTFGEGKLLITSTNSEDTNYYLPTGASTSAGPKYTTFTDVNSIDEGNLWTVTASPNANEYYISCTVGTTTCYLYTTSSNSGVRVATQNTPQTWKYDSSTNSLQYTGTSRFLGVYCAGSDWRSYTSSNAGNYKGTGENFTFYSLNSNSPKVTVTGDTYTKIDDVVTLTATPSNVSGTTTWSSSNESVATVDQSGNVTAKKIGKTTITATIGGVEGTLEFTVYPDDSELTIAEALEVCELTGTANCPFTYSTTGVIETIDTAYNSTHGNITVTITDGTHSIKAYRMVGGEELVVGDKIKVTGILFNYSGNTPEFGEGCTYEIVADDATTATARNVLKQINAFMSLAYKYTVTYSDESNNQVSLVENNTITFDFGANGNAEHYDNNTAKTSYTETVDDYTLEFTNGVKVYPGSRDAKGNSCLKLGTSSAAGSFSFIVPENVSSVVIYVARYKENTTKVKVNDVSYSIDGSSNDGVYDEIIVDTTTKKSVSFSTLSGGYRCMINKIDYVINSQEENGPTFTNDDFRLKCGVGLALSQIEGVDEWGIKVSAASESRYYTSESFYDADGECYFVVIGLGEALQKSERLSMEFTVEAYVKVNGIEYRSENSKTYSIASMVEEYHLQGISEVENLYNILVEKGLI